MLGQLLFSPRFPQRRQCSVTGLHEHSQRKITQDTQQNYTPHQPHRFDWLKPAGKIAPGTPKNALVAAGARAHPSACHCNVRAIARDCDGYQRRRRESLGAADWWRLAVKDKEQREEGLPSLHYY